MIKRGLSSYADLVTVNRLHCLINKWKIFGFSYRLQITFT